MNFLPISTINYRVVLGFEIPVSILDGMLKINALIEIDSATKYYSISMDFTSHLSHVEKHTNDSKNI